ncbi:XrtA/PEP-CTERM system-associated ATPase [Altericroceibacterium endophyticum]|uniref:AAA family ATPase n=1 Tax=Altericroceibacterium endophyticum TaxID=1808508 RepID=A0A6I4T5S5_9SPHN|nr:XrtA/PEP-CTERM system-associated ATPase [Altericroceibacterium endophyticum]MXO66028.1 AAA family ATPase [Altericroceibacterium endophyticum]
MFDSFYGLSGKPFQLTPDPAFYFRSITHRKALSYLGYGLQQGEGFIVITGEVGAGKSTLVAHLVSTIDPEELTVGQVVTSKLNENEVIHVVAQSFGLGVEGHDKASALGAIEAFLHDEARAGRRCLLILDEAQNLSVDALEELRMLSNFQLGNHPLLQTLLLGQPEFRHTLQSHPALEQLRQRVIAAHHLQPMQEDEIEAYITHRLKRVGWNQHPNFEADVFQAIFDASGGLPRKVNQIANRMLLLGAVEQEDTITAHMVDLVVEDMDSERAEVQVAPSPSDTESNEDEQSSQPDAPAAQASHAAASGDSSKFESMLAERDAQIAELQFAVMELVKQREAADEEDQDEPSVSAVDLADLRDRLDRLEGRMEEQEHTIRHTLTMLIEWVEGELNPAKAA